MFINSPLKLQEKKLLLEVFGKTPSAAIIGRAVEHSKEKSLLMPVIIFCCDEDQCR
ncbi:MAG: hypothetical protein ACMG6E_03115 [Candidatus Roizmanbacteria bacterium]